MSEQQPPPEAPSETAIQEALERILSHAPFKRSPVLSRFLNRVVEHAASCDEPPLKEYTIGLEVFDRPDDFDPRIDTIVRVQARRLRAALRSYYQNDGQHDAVRLDMPKGHYAIRARYADSMDDGAPASRSDAQPGLNAAFSTAPLPVARTPLIGRETELEQLTAMLKDEATRLLTITGVGGTGKTRLALAVAAEVHNAFAGGVLFLDLSAVTDRDVLLGMLADALALRRTEGRELQQALVERVRTSIEQPVLLVLDNMEGVVDGADVLGALLDATPLLTMLVTSRIALRLYGEVEYPLAPLRIPESDRRNDTVSLSEVPAVQLFLTRAAAANPHAGLDDELDTVAEICVRLDGLPLAIELVAAQAGAMGPRQMLERFTGHLDLPPNPARDAPARQRTLRRVIDWSHDLLDEPARITLRRLSVFSGGFTLEGAEAVADATGDLGDALLPAVNSLVALGLLYARNEEDESRLAMLETLRAYGRERLNASGEAEAVHKAHAAWCVVLAEEGVPRLEAAEREAWLARCDREQDNFRQAIGYLLRQGPQRWALRLGHALFGYWERREKFVEGYRLLCTITREVPVETDPAMWARVTSYAATKTDFHGDSADAEARFAHALELYRELGDKRGEASMLNALSLQTRLRGDESRARGFAVEALAVCRELGQDSEIAAALSNLAQCDLGLGQTEGVSALLCEARDLFLAGNDPVSALWCINHLGDLAAAEGRHDQAAELYLQAETGFRQAGDRWGAARSLADRGRLATDRGDLEQAAALLLQALAAFGALNHKRGMATVADSMAALAVACAQPELAMRIMAAAKSWRDTVGFSPPRTVCRFVSRIAEQALKQVNESGVAMLQRDGARMSPQDVAGCIESLLHILASDA